MQPLEDFLRAAADETDRLARWPGEQLRRCAEAGVLRWFAPPEFGGVEMPPSQLLRKMSRLAAACLSTTFCLTQPAGVIARLAACDNAELQRKLIPELLSGRRFASVGIAHLTTSRRHVQPVMRARETEGGYVLDGEIPWATGANQAAWIVTGAVLDDGRQLLAVLPTDLPGVTVEPPAQMVGLSATHTGPVRCEGVLLERRWLMAPVVPDVLKLGKGAGTGGLQTSALALGTALAAIDYLDEEAERRPDLVAHRRRTARRVAFDRRRTGRPGRRRQPRRRPTTFAAARTASPCERAQAALAAAKGSGYVVGHPAGRWCREALFFLVWSCPTPVTNATLCELARIGVMAVGGMQ